MKVSTKHVRHTTAHHATVLSVSRATINPPYRKNIGVLNPSMPRANISTSLERSYNPASFHNPVGRHFADVRVITVEQTVGQKLFPLWLHTNHLEHVPSSIARLFILIRVSGQINAL